MLVLGLESSCDETGVAVYDTTRGLLAHALYSQVALHADYGGVVPELASRDHVRRLLPLVRETLAAAGTTPAALDGVAYTAGPGLIGALLVGAATGRALAWALDVPSVGVHHMEGHLLSPLLEPGAVPPPFVCLLVSGGHTQLVAVEGIGRYVLLGETLDDAAGEAFDKTAKMLGLPYPGGPQLAALASIGRAAAHVEGRRESRFRFTRPMTDRPGLDFSFSGLKTQVLLAWQASDRSDATKADLALGFEDAVAETLTIKCERALQQTGMNALVVAGGVGANTQLRARLQALEPKRGVSVRFPRLEFCTDNGAMIAFAGATRLAAGQNDLLFRVQPRWDMATLDPVAALPPIAAG